MNHLKKSQETTQKKEWLKNEDEVKILENQVCKKKRKKLLRST
jgi:hypothetical protein